MNAKEARAEAQKVIDERERDRETKAEEKRLAEIQKAKKDKKDYLSQFRSCLDDEIGRAIKEGKTYCKKDLQSGYEWRGDAQEAFKNHPYIKEVTKILDEYRKDDFIIEEGVHPREHFSWSESQGSEYDCTTYTAFYTINW